MAAKKYVRNKAEKISNILEASKKLIENLSYENVTIRDIARDADVSIGLIYKYFPGGKAEIIREIGMRFATELTTAGRPENIDFKDFPSFLRDLFEKTLDYHKTNKRFLAALAVAAIQDRSVFEKFEELGEENLGDIVGFFSRFQGVDFAGKGEPWLFVAKWSDVTKSIIQHHAIYPTPFDSDEELIELLVKISLLMWGYQGLAE